MDDKLIFKKVASHSFSVLVISTFRCIFFLQQSKTIWRITGMWPSDLESLGHMTQMLLGGKHPFFTIEAQIKNKLHIRNLIDIPTVLTKVCHVGWHWLLCKRPFSLWCYLHALPSLGLMYKNSIPFSFSPHNSDPNQTFIAYFPFNLLGVI